MNADARVGRQLSIAGGILTALAVLLPPAIYFGLSYQYAAGSLEAEAEINSIAVTRIISTNPDLWPYEQVRLSELLGRRPRQLDAERRRVLDLDGHVLAESADPVPEPSIARSLPLLDAGVPVGRIEIARSLRPILIHALLFGLGLLPLGVMAFVTLRSVPLRAIRAGERALRRQRDAAQSYLDVAGVAFVRLDEALRVTLVNRQAETVLGRGAAEVVGQAWVSTFVEAGARDRVSQELGQVGHGGLLALEHAVIRPSGELRILAWFIAPAADEEGRPGLLASGVDVTRQRELEAHLLHAQKLEAVGRLAGGVAHEFNNILSVIKVYGSALRRALAADDPHRPDVEEIVAAADRAAAVARGLLAFSRRQAIEPVPVDLTSLVRSAERLLRPLLRGDIQLEVAVPGQPLTVLADPVQIEQVLLNLATNARDAIDGTGRITVSVSAELLDADQARDAGLATRGRYARLDVADDGAGFDAPTRNRIFEPFFTTKEVGKGTGLGLSVAYGIVAQHRGAIACESEPGRGATFTVRLPIIDASALATAVAATATALPGGTETVLVAEDDPSLRRVLRRLLEGVGYTVVEAEDGLDAVVKFEARRQRIHLVLLDVVMPGQNGRQALDRIRALEPTVPALFMSGHTADLVGQEEIQLGPERLLRKPVEPDDLLRAVRERLDAA
jgi:two-component system, cell cycle sensor histidine kinase and response regulator CckA